MERELERSFMKGKFVRFSIPVHTVYLYHSSDVCSEKEHFSIHEHGMQYVSNDKDWNYYP